MFSPRLPGISTAALLLTALLPLLLFSIDPQSSASSRSQLDGKTTAAGAIKSGRVELAPATLVVLQETTFWERHKWQISAIAGLFLFQSILIVALLIERSRRRRADSSQKETEDRNRAILNAIPDLMFVQSRDGVYLDFHARTPDLLLVPPDQFLGKKIEDVLPPALAAEVMTHFERALATGETQIYEYELSMQNERQWFEARIAPCNGNKLLSVVRNVTERKRAEEDIRSSEERFAKAFKANPLPMSLSTLNGDRYLAVNDSFVKMSCYSLDQILGHTSIELGFFSSPADRARLVGSLERDGQARDLETLFRTRDGNVRVLLSSAELLQLGGEACILITSNDITERKQLEEKLRLSEREFSTLVTNSPDVISRLDRELHYIYIGPALERIAGRRTEEFIGKTPGEMSIAGYDWIGFEAACRRAFTHRQTVEREFTFKGRHYRTRVIPELSAAGVVESVMSISEDVTERLRAEQELRKLTSRLFRLQDEERRRIARDLHDGAAQDLFGITINLANLAQREGFRDLEGTRILTECQSLAEQSLKELRTMAYVLHPPILDQAGLVLALRWYVEGFTRRTGIQVDLVALEDPGRLPSEIERALFRIVQESLTNIRRHSGSDTAIIRLETRGDQVRLDISDCGHGLLGNGDHAGDERAELGVGIPGMRQRLIQLGGELKINSNDQGTTIMAVVPALEGAPFGQYLAG